jgi:hypothetical protein
MKQAQRNPSFLAYMFVFHACRNKISKNAGISKCGISPEKNRGITPEFEGEMPHPVTWVAIQKNCLCYTNTLKERAQ